MITTAIGGLHIIIDVTDPANPTLVWPVDGAPGGLGLAFTALFAGLLGGGDMGDGTPNAAPGITLLADVFGDGERTYAIASFLPTGTRIMDITDPSNPALVSMDLGSCTGLPGRGGPRWGGPAFVCYTEGASISDGAGRGGSEG